MVSGSSGCNTAILSPCDLVTLSPENRTSCCFALRDLSRAFRACIAFTLQKVAEAKGFGLLGEYFNNRWTFGDPVVTRVDAKVDFSWSETETITPTGQDYISVRYGYCMGCMGMLLSKHVTPYTQPLLLIRRIARIVCMS